MTAGQNIIVEAAWGKTLLDPPTERGVTGFSSTAFYKTADSVGLSITGDISIIVDATISDWQEVAGGLVSKWVTSGNQRSYRLRLTTGGRLIVSGSPNGTSEFDLTTDIGVPFTAGRGMVGVEFEPDTGSGNHEARFYYSTDGGHTWILLDEQNGAPAGSFFDSTSQVAVGEAVSGGGTPLAAGDVIHEVAIYSGLFFTGAATLKANPHFHDSEIFDGTGSGADAQGNTWSASGAGTIGGDWSQISDYVMRGEFSMGRVRETDLFEAGTAVITLADSTRRFEPDYASSPLYPNVVPGVPIRVRVHYDSRARSRWTGFVDKWRVVYDAAAQLATVQAFCVDGAKAFNRLLLSAYVAEINADQPLGWWQLDETSGTAAVDSGTAGVNGVYTNPAAGVSLGGVGFRDLRGARFDDAGPGYVEIGTLTGSNVDGPWTIEAVVTIDPDETSVRMSVVTVSNSAVSDELALWVSGGASANPYRVGFRSRRTTTTTYNTTVDDLDGDPHVLALTGVGTSGAVAHDSYTSGSSPSGTAHTITLPAAPNGSLVIVTLSKTTNVTAVFPDGWTEVASSDLANANGGSVIAYRLYDSDVAVDSSIVVTTSGATAPNYVCSAFTGVARVEVATAASGATGTVNAPSLTATADPGASGLWVAAGAGRDTGGPVTTTPAGYTASKYRTGATLYNGIYYKAGGAGLTDDPAQQTTSSFEAWSATTFALFPVSGTNVIRAYVDGEFVTEIDDFDASADSGTMTVTIGKARSVLNALTSTVCQVAIFDKVLTDGRIKQHYDALIGRLPAARYDQRIGSLLDSVGYSGQRALDEGVFALTEIDTITIPPTSLLELLRQAADSEGGAVYFDEDGRIRGWAFDTRARYQDESQWTIGVDSARFPVMSLDDDLVFNRVLITASDGEIVAAESGDGTRVLDLGDLDLSAADALGYGKVLVARYESPVTRFKGVEIVPEASAAANWPEIRDLYVGQRVTLSFQPLGTGTTLSDDHHVEHVQVRFTPGTWVETWELSPADIQALWVLDSATNSVLDSTTRLAP